MNWMEDCHSRRSGQRVLQVMMMCTPSRSAVRLAAQYLFSLPKRKVTAETRIFGDISCGSAGMKWPLISTDNRLYAEVIYVSLFVQCLWFVFNV